MVNHSSIARAQPATGSIANSGVVSVFRDTGSRQTVPFSRHTSSRATIIQCSTNPECSSTRCEGIEPSRRQLRIFEANNKSARLAGHCSPMPNNDSLVSHHLAHDVPSRDLAAVSTSYKDLCPIMPILASDVRPHTGVPFGKRPLLSLQSTQPSLDVQYHQFRTSYRSVIFVASELNSTSRLSGRTPTPTTVCPAGPYSKLPKTSCPSSRRKRPTQHINLSLNGAVSR
jgi:hypothetical protein